MIKNTPQDCMGNQPITTKLWIALKLLSNPITLLLDKLGYLKNPMYITRQGVKFFTRGKTTDINDAVVVLSGHEYPKELLGLSEMGHPVILDVGGHIGTFTMYIKNLYPHAKIIAMEPVSDNRVFYNRNIKLNNYQNVTLLPYALYSQTGQFYIDLSNKQYDAVSVQTEKPIHDDYVTIDAVSFEDVINKNNIAHIDLMKLDIEGAEYDLLNTQLPIMSNTVKRIIMEYHPAGDKAKRNQLVSYFDQAGWGLVYETKNILGFDNNRFVVENE